MIIDDLKTSGTYKNITIDNLPGSSNNWAWAENQVWCSGSGTLLDPYIIEGHILNMSRSIDGVKISNSHNKYFIIRNCTFKWNELTNSILMTGIYLLNTTHGSIRDNLIYHLGYGIVLEDCQNINTTGNTIYDHVDGIKLINSDLNNIIGNTANNNSLGIYLYFCYDNTVSGNIANYSNDGIYLEESNNNTISGNTASGNSQNGIYSYFCDYNYITGNTVDNNYDGIYLDDDCNNNIISGNTATDNVNGMVLDDSNDNTLLGNYACNNSNNGMYLSNNCTNITISGNIANNNEVGMYIYNCHYNIITGNTANNNVDREGIVLDGSNDNIISGNGIDANEVGIFIYDALNNTFIGNTISNNNVSGIHIDEDSDYNEFTENIVRNNTIGLNIAGLNDNNLVYKNFFLENGIHAYDDGTDNKWNSTTIGNYWDNHTTPDVSPQDGIIDDPYTFIAGPSGSIDYLPIAEDGAPTITIHSPSAGSKFGSTAPSFNVEVIDDYLFEMWYSIDGGLNNYTIVENGTIDQSAWDSLPDGSVTITFYAIDMASNEASEEVTVIKGVSVGLEPGVIAVIVVVSVIGGAVLVGAILVILEKKGKISLEKLKGLLPGRK
jgi:parallel beta-helix repeat protein